MESLSHPGWPQHARPRHPESREKPVFPGLGVPGLVAKYLGVL